MSLWSDTPRIQGPPDTQDVGQILAYVKDLANTVAKMAKDLEFLVNGNLDANNIRANSIETKNLKANSITADKIQAGAVTAEKISVNELSAISANLGHIVAGLIESVEIYGAYIATRRNSYPRAEMDSTQNLFGAYAAPNNFLSIQALSGQAQSPQMVIMSPFATLFTFISGSVGYLGMTGADLRLSSSKDISIQAKNIILSPDGVSNYVLVSFDQLKDNYSNTTLYQQLLGKANVSEAGYNLVFDGATRNLKMFSKSGTLLAQVNIPK